MNHASLFSGIGGFDYAAEIMGWSNVLNCEINPFCQKVLNYYWPNATQYADIKSTDFSIYRGQIDILTAGFPCQPFSLAGKRKGTDDDRYLWPETLRAIREIKPRWVVGENVYGIVNWNGGMVFEQVQADLENEGYEVQPYILPACGVNAPHKRYRVWFVAKNTLSDGCVQREPVEERTEVREFGNACTGNSVGVCGEQMAGNTTNAESTGLEGQNRERMGETIQPSECITPDPNCDGFDRSNGKHEVNTDQRGVDALDDIEQMSSPDTDISLGCEGRVHQTGPVKTERHAGSCNTRKGWNAWRNFPTQPPVCSRNDELSSGLVGYIKAEIYGTISERYTDKDLQEVRQAIQAEDVQRKIGGLYKIHEPGILFQVLQLCSPTCPIEKGTSVWSEEASEKLLRKLREYGTLANTPQGRELEKQFREQFGYTLPVLSHEVALVAMETTRAAGAAISKHRNESIKAYGNAIVPQVALQIFKAIKQYEALTPAERQGDA